MFSLKKLYGLSFLLFAALNFVFLSLGGVFLHEHVHHHHDEASFENCFLSQLQIQVFVVLLGVCSSVIFKVVADLPLFYFIPVLPMLKRLPASRAPPYFF